MFPSLAVALHSPICMTVDIKCQLATTSDTKGNLIREPQLRNCLYQVQLWQHQCGIVLIALWMWENPSQCGWHLPKEEDYSSFWLGFPSGCWVNPLFAAVDSFADIRSSLSGLLYGLWTSSSPGTLHACGIRLRPLRHTALLTERSADSQLLWCEVLSWTILTTLHKLI